ncbi:single-stranded DNA-binding protein (plasmid) [Bacteroides thetaiotaomicron]|nr:single-stranded DNA-binding protein [Bacteroides thetaiotaomicron]MCS3371751.1 single-stranded DNA-binding protein [Bacteroides thetaiotaomicron]
MQKKPKKVVLLTYLINIEKKEQIKPYGYLVSLIMKQRSWIFLKTGTPVYVNGDITISTYSRETGEVVPTVTMSVRKIELLPNKNKE